MSTNQDVFWSYLKSRSTEKIQFKVLCWKKTKTPGPILRFQRRSEFVRLFLIMLQHCVQVLYIEVNKNEMAAQLELGKSAWCSNNAAINIDTPIMLSPSSAAEGECTHALMQLSTAWPYCNLNKRCSHLYVALHFYHISFHVLQLWVPWARP